MTHSLFIPLLSPPPLLFCLLASSYGLSWAGVPLSALAPVLGHIRTGSSPEPLPALFPTRRRCILPRSCGEFDREIILEVGVCPSPKVCPTARRRQRMRWRFSCTVPPSGSLDNFVFYRGCEIMLVPCFVPITRKEVRWGPLCQWGRVVP